MSHFHDLFDIYGTILEQHDIQSTSLIEFEAEGLPDQALMEWVEHYHAICPRLAFLQDKPAGTVGYDYKVVDRSTIKKHPMYQEFLRPHGTQYFMSATLEHDSDRYTTVALQRTSKQGHVTERDIELIGLLTKPMQRAFKLKRQLMLDKQKLSDYEAAFHELQVGIVIVDDKGRVSFINNCADQIVREGQFLSIKSGYLSLFSRGAQRALRMSLLRLALESNDDFGEAVCIAGVSTHTLPLRVDFLPLPTEASFATRLVRDQSPGNRLLVMLSDPRRQIEPPEKVLRAFFGLTPMETRLALAIGKGTKLSDYAEQYEIALTTARTHLAHLRQKMGAQNQAEVVRLIARVTQPLID